MFNMFTAKNNNNNINVRLLSKQENYILLKKTQIDGLYLGDGVCGVGGGKVIDEFSSLPSLAWLVPFLSDQASQSASPSINTDTTL
jgi:hypothetical protein